MGWDGFSQNWCANGHFFPGTAGYDGEPSICTCRAPIVIHNVVDDTNGTQDGVIPPEVLATLLIEPEEKKFCDLGHEHVTAMAIYRIPTEEELRLMAHWWDEKASCYRPIVDCAKHNQYGEPDVRWPALCERCGGEIKP